MIKAAFPEVTRVFIEAQSLIGHEESRRRARLLSSESGPLCEPGRLATHRAGLEPGSFRDALCVTIVGNRG